VDQATPLVLLKHYFGRLDHDGDFVTFLQAKLLGAPACNDTFYHPFSDAHVDVRHDVAQRDFDDFSF